MKYFVPMDRWQATGDGSGEWILRFPDACLHRWPLDDGAVVHDWDTNVFAYFAHPGDHVDFPPVIGEWDVVSERMQRVIEAQAPGEVQFLPFRIRSPIGEIVAEPYAIANYLHVVGALAEPSLIPPPEEDDEEGCFEPWTVTLNVARLGDLQIFRVVDDEDRIEPFVAYREDVVEALDAASVTGIVFKPLRVCRP